MQIQINNNPNALVGCFRIQLPNGQNSPFVAEVVIAFGEEQQRNLGVPHGEQAFGNVIDPYLDDELFASLVCKVGRFEIQVACLGMEKSVEMMMVNFGIIIILVTIYSLPYVRQLIL